MTIFRPLWLLLQRAKPCWRTLGVAYGCMAILNITHVLYAALCGPALHFVFTGEPSVMLRTTGGELRTLVAWLPAAWVTHAESMPQANVVWWLPVLIVLVAVIRGTAQALQFVMLGRVSQRILHRVRVQTFEALLQQSPEFYAHRPQGDLLTRLTTDANGVEQALFYGFGSLLRDTLGVLALLGYVFYADPKLALVTLVTVPVALVPLARFSKWLKHVARGGLEQQGAINTIAHETLLGIDVVQSFGAQRRQLHRITEASARYKARMGRGYFIRGVRAPTMEVLGAIAMAILVGLLSAYVQRADVDPAHYMSFIGAVFLMYDPLKRLGRVSDYLASGSAAADRILEIMQAPPSIVDHPNAVTLPNHHTAHDVSFQNVCFRYTTTSEHPTLDNICINVPAKSRIAIVGPSGAGKTTLTKLVPRFYDVASGHVKVGGRNVRQLTLASLRKQIAVVGQDVFLFNGTILENIAFGNPNVDSVTIKEEAEAAAKAAYAHDFISALPKGYDSRVGERGVALSGGQKQRIAIARALLKDAPILIFDEATSHLDAGSEKQLRAAVQHLMVGRTVLVIAHRIETVCDADHIYVIDHGRIIANGSHEQLFNQSEAYTKLCGGWQHT